MKLSTAKRIQSIGSLIVVGTMLLDVASYFVEHLLAYLLGTTPQTPFRHASAYLFFLGIILFYLGTWKTNDHNRNPYNNFLTNCKCHR